MHRSTFLPLQHAATLIFSVDWGLTARIAPIAEWNASLAPSSSKRSTFRVVSVRTPDTLYTFGRVSTFIAMDIEDYWFSNHQRTFLLH